MNNGGTLLRVLILRYISLNDVITLIGSITMPVLEELILIDMHDDNRLGQFQELCNSSIFPALKTLHFSLCFPQEIEHEWKMNSFNSNRQWPFDSINFHMDECYMHDNISTTLNCDLHWNLSLNHLRSLTFYIKSNPLQKYQRIVMVERILDASPNLWSLAGSWRIFRYCSRKYLSLKHVHLLLDGHYGNPKRYFNIHRLHELVPHLHLLETSDAVMMLNKNLVEVIVNISHQFDQLSR
ncbi:hypothetical protein I4U23_003649 [Adineta vaga]|nr:hypothetical protein I4U23_003649 [Adineta vaga]